MRALMSGVLIVCALALHQAGAQEILAGQTTGPNIHYFDIEDVFVSSGSYCLDVNQDDSCELEFIPYYSSYHTGYSEGIYVNARFNTEICNYPDHVTWLIRYLTGDTIGGNCVWSGESGMIWTHTWDIISGESYGGRWGSGIGYMGFRIPKEEGTIVGWCRIQSYNAAYITILDCAYYSEVTSVPVQPLPEPGFRCNSLVKDHLYITISEHKGPYQYQCMDVAGHQMAAGLLQDGNNDIPLSFLPGGIYFLRLYSGEVVKTVKFAVE